MGDGLVLIDTHAHLDFPQFRDRLDDVLDRAKKSGVVKVVTVGINEETSLAALNIARRYPGVVYPTLGLHPHDARLYNQALVQRFSNLLNEGEFVAVGETGLDYAKEYSPREVQRRAFSFQMALARAHNIPVIVHTRQADRDSIEILKAEARSGVRGVIHCFSGGKALLETALDLGFYISCSGMITFPWADKLRKLIAWCPIERVLIETDCPFLAPVPYRGRDNEPKNVYYVAKELARIKSMDVVEVAQWTTKNAADLFGSFLG